jgi:uncharacterized protein (DUF302 family)
MLSGSIRKLFYGTGLALGLLAATPALAGDNLKPYVLASESKDPLAAQVEAVRGKLKKDGFEVVGEYDPYDNTHILVATSPDLKKLAAQEPNMVYLLGLRVAVTHLDDGTTQVAFANPEYYRNAYRVNASLKLTYEKLVAALGKVKDFGSIGVDSDKLRNYNYAFGMEYFTDAVPLATHKNHADALQAVNNALKEKRGGVTKVYEVSVPESSLTVVGVSMTDGMSGDQAVMKTIDVMIPRHSPHLPYEMAIFDNKVFALHPRFRIAIGFPDLKMVGDHGFMKLMKTPEAIEKALTLAAGGTWTRPPPRNFIDQ